MFCCLSLPLWVSWLLELQGWKIIHPNRSSHNTLCEHLWLQTPLQQWVGAHKFIIITSLASCQAGHEARSRGLCHRHTVAVTARACSLGKTCWLLCDKSLSCACPGDEELPPWLLEKLSFSCRCLQVHLGCCVRIPHSWTHGSPGDSTRPPPSWL